MYKKLIDLLRSEALEEENPWTITTFHDFIAVEATTKKTASDRHGGWQLASSLCDAIFELGYEFSGDSISRLGVTSVWGTKLQSWRGTIELRLTPVSDNH